jgi:hypothetical protein
MKSIKLTILFSIILLSMVLAKRGKSKFMHKSQAHGKLKFSSKSLTKADLQYCTDLKTLSTSFVTSLNTNYKGYTLEVKGTATDATLGGSVTYSILLKINSYTLPSSGTCSAACDTDDSKTYKVSFSDLTMDITGIWRLDYNSLIKTGVVNFTSKTNTFEVSKAVTSTAQITINSKISAAISALEDSNCQTDTSITSIKTNIQTIILNAVTKDTSVTSQIQTWWSAFKTS